MCTIDEFIDELKSHKNTSTVTNPYLVEGVAANLRKYLEAMLTIKGKRVLLVGEAPGYKGCKITGIPFTSGRVLEKKCRTPCINTTKRQVVAVKN